MGPQGQTRTGPGHLKSLGNIFAGKRFLFLSLVGTVSLEEDAGAQQPDPQESAVSNLC